MCTYSHIQHIFTYRNIQHTWMFACNTNVIAMFAYDININAVTVSANVCVCVCVCLHLRCMRARIHAHLLTSSTPSSFRMLGCNNGTLQLVGNQSCQIFIGLKDAPQKMQFLGTIKKLASLVPWRQNAKWQKPLTESTVTKISLNPNFLGYFNSP